jgi:O-antigen ligase
VLAGALLLFGLTTVAAGVLMVYAPLPLLALLGAVAIGFSMLFSVEPFILGVLLFRRTLDIQEFFGFVPFYSSTVSTPNGILVFVLIVGGLWWILSRRINISDIPLIPQWSALLALAGIGVIRASDRAYALGDLVRLASYAFVYILVFTMVRSRKQVYRLLAVFLLATVVPNIVGMYNVLFVFSKFRYLDVPRLYRSIGSGPAHGLFLITPLLITLVLLSQSRSLWARVTYVFVLVSLAVPFFYTLARGAWIGLFGALLVFVVVSSTSKQRRWFVSVLLILLAAAVFIPAISERLVAIRNPGVDPSLLNRILTWRKSLELFKSSPFIGVGLGTTDRLVGVLTFGTEYVMHNDYVRVLTDMGILGLLGYLWLYLALLRQAYAAYQALNDTMFKSLAAIGISAWVAFQIGSFWNPVFTHSVLQFSYWAFAGLALSLPVVEQQKSRTGWIQVG